jgi:integrase
MPDVVYNEKIKNLFLNQFNNQDTVDVYKRIFKKSKNMEVNKNKDIFNFDEDELEYFIANGLNPKTKESARTYCNVLSSYIQWSIDNNFSKHETNPLRRRQEYFYNFVQDTKLYISKEEKDSILYALMNPQDQFIIQALFEGIQGSQVSELVNLKLSDFEKVGEQYYVHLKDNKGKTRTIPVEEKTFELAELANKQQEYYKKNGEMDYSTNIKDIVMLPPKSEYVLKTTKTNPKNEGKKVSHYTIYNRLEMIKNLEEFEEYQDALTTKNIVRSGMIYMAKTLLERDGELGRKQIEEICERFGLKYKWSLRDFLNVDTINELYETEYNIDENGKVV